MASFTYGTHRYTYEVVRQSRKSIALTVYPDLRLEVRCPEHATAERIEDFLKRKWRWLDAQMTFFAQFSRKRYPKEYVSGESFLYLGRQYTLNVRTGAKDYVTVEPGKLVVYTRYKEGRQQRVKQLLDRWYRERARVVYTERMLAVLPKFSLDESPALSIKVMQKRWGSYLNDGSIVLHPALVQAPKHCIDYVLVHELCHTKYKNHSGKFYSLLDAKYPGWQKVKQELEERLC